MIVEYGFLTYDLPKKAKDEVPSKLFNYKITRTDDLRATAVSLAEDVYGNLNGKETFRFYIKGENGVSSTYQVNFHKESRDFFESELEDDLRTLVLTKK